MLMNKPGSAIVGYGLKVARIPSTTKRAYSGSCLQSLNTNNKFL